MTRGKIVLGLLAFGALLLVSPKPGSASDPLDILTYRVHTIYQPPSGDPIETDEQALLVVPSLVDVDHQILTGTGGADVLVQLTIDAGRATLRASQLPGAPAPLPLKLEIILADPRGESDLRVAFGYDALASTAPAVFNSTIQLIGAQRVTSFSLDVEQAGAGATMGIVAEVFDEGPNGERLDPQRGRVDVTPVPQTTHFGILQGKDLNTQQSGLDLAVDIPTVATVVLEDIQGDREVRGDATIDTVPNLLSLVLTESADGKKTWDYHATDRIDLLTLGIRETQAAAIVDDFSLRLEDMAMNAVLVQDTPTHATFQADSPIGAVEAGSANGRAIGTLDEPAFVYSTNVGGGDSFAFRILGLSRAEVDSGDPFLVDVTMQPGPFHVLIEDGTRLIDGRIRDLPGHIRLRFSATQGTIDWEGSDPIGEIEVTAMDPAGLAGRATRLHLLIEDVPKQISLTWQEQSGVAKVDAHDGVVGSIELLLTSGRDLAVDSGFDGVVFEDVADHYALAVRLTGLRLVSVTAGTPPYALDLRKAPGPFLVRLLDDQRSTRIEVHDLPASLQATLDPAGSLGYTASAPIGEISAEITDTSGIVDRATRLHLLISDLPTQISLGWEQANGKATIDAGDGAIGSIDLLLTSGPEIAVDPGFDGVVFENVTDHYALVVKLTGLRFVSVTSGASPYELDLRKAPGPFLVRLLDAQRSTRIEVHDLPDSLQATLDSAAGTLTYAASATIGEISAEITDPAGVSGRATRLRLAIDDVPKELDLTWQQVNGVAKLDAKDGTVGLIDLLLTSGPDLAVDQGFEGVILEDVADDYALAVKLSGLRFVSVTAGAPPYTLDLRKAPGPFLVRLLDDQRSTRVEVLDLPGSLQATFDPAGSLTYTASAPIGEINAEITDPAGVAGRATRATALLRGLPTSLDVSWDATTGTVAADAKGQTLGLLEVLLTSGPEATLPADRDGIVVQDLADRYVVFGRVTGLKKITVAQGPPPSFALDTLGGRIFVVDIQTQKPQGVATTDATITVLPASLSIQFTGPTMLSYTASGPVSSLTLDAFDPVSLSGRATALHALIQSLPSAFDASWSATDTVTIDAKGGTIGLVEIQLTSGPDDRIPSQFDGILVEDLTDRYVVFARITGLRKLVGTQTPQPDVTLETTGGRVFKADLNQVDGARVKYTRATLDSLPASVRVRIGEQEIFYDASAATNSLVFDTNSGDRWNLHADIRSPLPAHMYFCAAGNGFCNGFARSSGAGSFKFDASAHTNVNVFDCVRPLSSSCVRGSADNFTQVDDWVVRHFEFDADSDSTGFSGYTFNNTNGHSLQGYLKQIDGSSGFEADIHPGYSSVNRRVSWTFFGLSKDKSGSVNCAGSSFSIRVFGIWIGVTSYVC